MHTHIYIYIYIYILSKHCVARWKLAQYRHISCKHTSHRVATLDPLIRTWQKRANRCQTSTLSTCAATIPKSFRIWPWWEFDHVQSLTTFRIVYICMYICMYVCICRLLWCVTVKETHTYTQSCVHTCMHAYTFEPRHRHSIYMAYIHTYVYARIHTYIWYIHTSCIHTDHTD